MRLKKIYHIEKSCVPILLFIFVCMYDKNNCEVLSEIGWQKRKAEMKKYWRNKAKS